DQNHNDDQNNADERYSVTFGLRGGLRGSERLNICQLNSSVGGDDIGHTGCDQQKRLTVIPAAHQRNRFPLEVASLAIGQNRLKSVSDFNARFVILDCVKNQHSAIRRFVPDSPSVEQAVGIGLNVGAIERVDRYQCDLRVSVVVDLAADVGDLSSGAR